MDSKTEKQLRKILEQYQTSFSEKIYKDENDDFDVLMKVFDLTPELKRENRQYWGRELGMCWQRLVCALFELRSENYLPALRIEADEPCDCIVGKDAVDTKYRIGSGDSGTLKKFKQYGKLLREEGYNPLLLILREDNLPAAIKACESGDWTILTGKATFDYIEEKSSFDLYNWLDKFKDDESLNVER